MTNASTTSRIIIKTHPIDFQWQGLDPYFIPILLMIVFVFNILLVLVLVFRRMCSRSSNNEGIELGYLGVCRVDMDLFSVSRYCSDDYSDENDSMCSICLDVFIDEDEIITLPVCGHIHHRDCITRLFAFHSSRCPICRHDYGGYSATV